jgi:hypothetical protein
MKGTYKQCQSCGVPLQKDERGGGTNAAGSKNAKYCSHCFASGQFTLPQISADEMQARVKGKLRESGVPSVTAWFLTRGIPRATSGREPVMKEKLRFLGLDVHAETIAVAIAEPDGEVRSLGNDSEPHRIDTQADQEA